MFRILSYHNLCQLPRKRTDRIKVNLWLKRYGDMQTRDPVDLT
jgi:hypothetical protein